MIETRARAALAVVLALTISACSDNESTAPTPVATPAPAPAPAPTPSGPTFTVSGTISETAPTTSTRVPDAEVLLSGGVATGSIADGTFTVPNVANGTYTLRVAKAGYETATRSVTVSGGNVSGIQVNLLPVFRWVDQEFYHQLGPGNASSCPGLTDGRPCRSYRGGVAPQRRRAGVRGLELHRGGFRYGVLVWQHPRGAPWPGGQGPR